MSSSAGRRCLVTVALTLAAGLPAACGTHTVGPAEPSGSTGPAGPSGSTGPVVSGGLVGHMSGTSDVAGQPGDPALGGGRLAVIPVEAMDDRFWGLTGQERVDDPRGWSYLAFPLSEAQVAELGGTVVPIDDAGGFRVAVPPGEYGVCRWPDEVGGGVTGCDAVDLPAEGELEATDGEAGFRIDVVG